jgi:hypothetical protein
VSLQNLASTTAALALLTGLTACQSGSKYSESLQQADDIVTRIERVHVECELSKDRAREAAEWLRAIVSGDFEGDALTAYNGFVEAVDASEKQSETLNKAVSPMERAAEPYFDDWSNDLNAFTSPKLRRRSQVKLNRARHRYEEIAMAVEPTQASYEAYNHVLKDIALFLSHDLNAAGELKRDVRSVMKLVDELNEGFDETLEAAQTYVQNSALPSGVRVMVEPEDETYDEDADS